MEPYPPVDYIELTTTTYSTTNTFLVELERIQKVCETLKLPLVHCTYDENPFEFICEQPEYSFVITFYTKDGLLVEFRRYGGCFYKTNDSIMNIIEQLFVIPPKGFKRIVTPTFQE